MSNRAHDWFRQAEADLRHARHAQRDADYDWACFAARQAAEKAATSACLAVGHRSRRVMVTESLELLRPRSVGIHDELLDRARALDKLDLPTRYPNFFASG